MRSVALVAESLTATAPVEAPAVPAVPLGASAVAMEATR
jgi:hypothetical protein